MANPHAPYLDGCTDILSELDDKYVLSLRLNRPKARNALRTQLLHELAQTLGKASRDEHVRCVVLTGGEKVFAAGADITEMADKTPVDVLNDPRADHWAAIRAFNKPLIGAVNGFCLGGGMNWQCIAIS